MLKKQLIAFYIALYTLTAVLIGCSSSQKKDDSIEPPKKVAKTLIGYGLAWSSANENPRKLADILYHVGANVTLKEIDGKESIDKVAVFVNEMRKRNITTEIIIVNGNSLELFKNSDSWFFSQVDQLISKVGYDKVILQPICEPGNRGGDLNKMRRWMKYAYDKWKGKKVQPDKWIGPEFKGQDYIETHWCTEFKDENIKRGGNRINTTDCGPMIDVSPDKVYRMTKSAIRTNSNFIYYHANRDHINDLKIDYGKMDAIKRAIQES